MVRTENFEYVEISSVTELHDWLSSNHEQTESVWLVTYKKSVPGRYVSTSEVLDELLCFGWIDGIRRKLDEQRTMQLIAPRKTQHWAATYKTRVAKLIEEKRMQPSGFKEIERSKANGLWNFMDDVDALIIPDDLEKALAEKKHALAFFTAINPSSKRFALRWLKLAKTTSTRNKRITKLVGLAARSEKLPGS